VRRAKTCLAGVAGCDAIANGQAYLQVPLCATPPAASASTATTHALAVYPSATEFVHKLKDCATDAPLRPYVIYLYFVGTDNVLKRAEFINGTGMGNVTSLVDGIENLQLDYGIDTDNDGNADSYTGDPTSVSNWSNVVTVKINLLARNVDASPGYKDTKTYYLGQSAGNVGPFNDNIRRHVYTTLVRINNVSARREKP
jgi:type IV pilus assembly protein PilW